MFNFAQQKAKNVCINDKKSHDELIILQNVPLADKNNFGTGGNATFYCRPQSALTFAKALSFAHEHNLEIFVLGGGANVLISDAGFSGLVIHPAVEQIEIIPNSNDNSSSEIAVKAGSGTSIETLINFCLNHQILGLEEFSGIPGTVGGAVYINLHYYEFLLEQFLMSATIIHKKTNEITVVDPSWFQFGYDQSKLQNKEYFLIDATFKLKKADAITTAYAKGRSQEIIRHRRKRYPYENTCGSFFRNFHPQEVINTHKQLIYVAYYLDQLGVKGELSIGGAIVSHQHANMIVCKNGTSTDIVQLTLKMQKMVSYTYGIKPQPECQLVGFDTNPFL